MSQADLHIHTSLSDGMMDVGVLLAYVEAQGFLDVLAITDHDDITAAFMAQELTQKHGYRAQIVIGEEITTRSGHLLGLFLERPVARLQSLEMTLQAIHDQGGLAVIPHPMSWLTFSVGQSSMERVMASQVPGVYFDGLEVANPSMAAKVTRERVQQLNDSSLHLAELGSTDAHFLPVLGSAFTQFEGTTPEELRQAILERATRGEAKDVALSEIGYGEIVLQQVRSLVVAPTRALSEPIKSFLKGERPKE